MVSLYNVQGYGMAKGSPSVKTCTRSRSVCHISSQIGSLQNRPVYALARPTVDCSIATHNTTSAPHSRCVLLPSRPPVALPSSAHARSSDIQSAAPSRFFSMHLYRPDSSNTSRPSDSGQSRYRKHRMSVHDRESSERGIKAVDGGLCGRSGRQQRGPKRKARWTSGGDSA